MLIFNSSSSHETAGVPYYSLRIWNNLFQPKKWVEQTAEHRWNKQHKSLVLYGLCIGVLQQSVQLLGTQMKNRVGRRWNKPRKLLVPLNKWVEQKALISHIYFTSIRIH